MHVILIKETSWFVEASIILFGLVLRKLSNSQNSSRGTLGIWKDCIPVNTSFDYLGIICLCTCWSYPLLFFYTTHPHHSPFPLLLLVLLHLPPHSDPLPFWFSLEKNGFLRDSNKTQQNTLWYDKIKLSHQNWTRQTKRRKRAPREGIRIIHPLIQKYSPLQKNKLKVIMYMHRTWYQSIQALCMLLQSIWVHMSFAQLILRCLFTWCPPLPLALTLCLSSLPQDSLNFEKRNLMETSHLELCIPTYLSLSIMFVFAPICNRNNILWWGWNNSLIY